MSRGALAILVAILRVVGGAGLAEAQEKEGGGDEPGARVESIEVGDRVQGDGSLVRWQRNVATMLTPAGVQQYSQVVVFFFDKNQKPEVTKLRLAKTDGRVLDLLPDAPHQVVSVLPLNIPMFSDFKALRYAVPSLEEGDRLEFDSRVEIEPLAPGQAWSETAFAAAKDVATQSYELDAPEGMPLVVHVRDGLSAQLEEETRKGRHIRRWRLQGAAEEEAGAAKKTEPDVQMTSFASWEAFGAWWGGLAPAVVNDAVRAKAEELIQGIDEPKARLAALDRFVAGKVRYLSLPLGLGRYRAREPDEVMRTGLGDCKDKVRLLQSLAAAVGIEIEPVLVNASGRSFSEGVPGPLQFDHVIARARLGGGEIWMDPTSEMTPAGRLPQPDRGRRGLAMVREEGGLASRLVTTPAELPEPPTERTEVVGEITADGVIELKVRRTFEGDDEPMRLVYKYGNEAVKKGALTALRSEWESKAEFGESAHADPEDLDYPFWVEYDVSWTMSHDRWAKDWDLWVPVPKTKIAVPPEEDAETIPDTLELGGPTRQIVSARIEIPAGVETRAPIPIEVKRDFADYRSDYRIEGDTLILERELDIKAKEIGKESYGALRSFRKLIVDDRKQEFDFAAAPEVVPPERASAGDLEGSCYDSYEAGRYVEAAEACVRAVEADPESTTAWNNLGRTLIRLMRYDEAEKALRRQIEIAPDGEHAYANLGWLYEERQDWDAAEESFRKQIDVAPFEPYSYYALAELLLWRKRFDGVEALYRKALQIDPDEERYQAGLLGYFVVRRQAGEASAWLLEHPDLPMNLEQRLFLSDLLLAAGTGPWEPLRPWFERLRKESEEKLAGFDGALPDRESLMAVQGLTYAWTALGEAAIERKDYAAATEMLGAAMRLSFSAEAAEALGRMLGSEGKEEEAERSLALAAELERSGSQRIRAVFEKAVANAPTRTRLEMAAKEETWKMRSLTFLVPAGARSSGGLWLVFDRDGSLLHAEPAAADGPRALAKALAQRPPTIELPAANRARIPLLAEAYCDAAGSCTLVLQPPGAAWQQIRQDRPSTAAP